MRQLTNRLSTETCHLRLVTMAGEAEDFSLSFAERLRELADEIFPSLNCDDFISINHLARQCSLYRNHIGNHRYETKEFSSNNNWLTVEWGKS